MKPAYRTAFIALACCAAAGAQQHSKTNWSAAEITVGTIAEISTAMRTLTPDEGMKVLEVKALIRSANPARLLIPTGEVLARTGQNAKLPLAAVGLVGKNGGCTYEITRGLVKGYTSLEDAAGNGFKLGREKEEDPLAITMNRNATRLCFAFIVPESTKSGLTLHLADTTAPLKLP